MSRRHAKHFERQGETAFSPQPPNQNRMDAVLIRNSRLCRHTIDNTVKLFENFCLATLHNIQIFSACYRRSDDAI
jgi:hypothetical protein